MEEKSTHIFSQSGKEPLFIHPSNKNLEGNTDYVNYLLRELESERRQRKDAEDSLRVERQRFHVVLNRLSAGLCILNSERKIEYANPSLVREFGPHQGQGCRDYLHHAQQPCPWCQDANFLTAQPRMSELYSSRNGKSYMVLDAPFFADNGHLSRIGLFLDITERKEQEQQTRASLRAALASVQAKSSFFAHISHEIRNYLNTLLGVIEVFATLPVADEHHPLLRMASQSSADLLGLLNDILDLAKIEAKQMDLESVPFDPTGLAKDCLELHQFRAKEKGIFLIFQPDGRVPQYVMGDPGRIRQVLVNLIGNGIKFTHQGEIRVKVELMDDNLILYRVSDTGVGISPDNIKTVFDPFAQGGAATSRRFGGTGLGLTICQQMVETMRGIIWVESQVGKGSVFSFILPLQAVVVPMADSIEFSAPPRVKPMVASGNERPLHILLADDAEENILLIQTFLAKTPHTITTAADGYEALEKFRSGTFQLVLIDLGMPVMNGLEAIQEIRRWENEHHLLPVPIIALTGAAFDEDRRKVLAAGGTRHMAKPISRDTLLEAIRQFSLS